MENLFNIKDGEEVLGVKSLNKANKKGTPQYEEWLRKYREKREGFTGSEKSPSDKDTQRAQSLAALAQRGKYESVRRLFKQIKDDGKIQRRYDKLKEYLSDSQIKELNSHLEFTVPSLIKERKERKALEQSYKDNIKAKVSTLSEKWNEKFKKHFYKIADRDKAISRLSLLETKLGRDNPALVGLDDLVRSNSEHKKNYGYFGESSLARKNNERVDSFVEEYSKELNNLGLTKDDFKSIGAYDGFYTKLKNLIK